jgi:hypothetical protein
MCKPFAYLVVTYFLENGFPRWNTVLTKLTVIHNWVTRGIIRYPVDDVLVPAGPLWVSKCGNMHLWRRLDVS